MPGYSYAPSGVGAAYMGMMGRLRPMREPRGSPGFGAASYGMYGSGYGGGRRYQRPNSANNQHFRQLAAVVALQVQVQYHMR